MLIYFESFLQSLNSYSVLQPFYQKNDYIPIDLSVKNQYLKRIDLNSDTDLDNFISNYIKSNGAKIAYGGYLEERSIYKRSAHFKNGDLQRNIHLGIDFWTQEGEPVFAPLDATVHSYKNNSSFGDYGPTIILMHQTDHYKFYTLYGHLSLEALADIRTGKAISAGQPFARIGSYAVNGNYPPHLHFQIIQDLGDFTGDYPGVCSKNEVTYYKSNCPNPLLLLGL